LKPKILHEIQPSNYDFLEIEQNNSDCDSDIIPQNEVSFECEDNNEQNLSSKSGLEDDEIPNIETQNILPEKLKNEIIEEVDENDLDLELDDNVWDNEKPVNNFQCNDNNEQTSPEKIAPEILEQKNEVPQNFVSQDAVKLNEGSQDDIDLDLDLDDNAWDTEKPVNNFQCNNNSEQTSPEKIVPEILEKKK